MKNAIAILTCLGAVALIVFWQNYPHRTKIIPLDHTKSVRLVKIAELPAEFRHPDDPNRPMLQVRGKDGHDFLLLREKFKRLEIVRMTDENGMHGFSGVVGRIDDSSAAPEGSTFVHDLTLLSDETGVDCHKILPLAPQIGK